MSPRAALLLVLALPVAAASAPPATRIQFAPAEGLALRKTFESRSTQELDSVSVTVHGEEQEQDQEQTTETTTRLVVVDRYLAREGARVTKLERDYEEFELSSDTEMSFGGEEHSGEATASNELDGHTVLFTWDEEEERYEASSEDEEVEADWLEELDAELDLRALLPEGEVEVDDEWSVDAEALRSFLRYERGLPLEWERSTDGEAQILEDDTDEEAPEEEVSGELSARFEGLREEDGVELAVIALSGVYRAVTHFEDEVDGEHGTQSTVAQTTHTVELEGELLWDLAGGHLRSCRLEAESGTESSADITMEFMDQEMSIEQRSETSGTLVFTARFELAE